jgi:amidase
MTGTLPVTHRSTFSAVSLRLHLSTTRRAIVDAHAKEVAVPVERPKLEELRRIAEWYGFKAMDNRELGELSGLIDSTLDTFRRLDQIEDPVAAPPPDRDPGRAPTAEENPLKGWVWRCRIEGSGEGPLAGKTVAIKDNVQVAGVPMKIGSNLLDGFIPDEDATLVTRTLAAGGTIIGKAACEHMSYSGSSFTADTGAVLNPHDPTRTTGGSSSGAGALVVSGACDIANGGDQAGSIRIPASFSGCYGLKPTYGLVPTTGIYPIEHTVDHVGPMAATVTELAAFLDAVAGEDPLDPRQRAPWKGNPKLPDYRAALTGDVRGLRVGIVEEGFGWSVSEDDVDSAVREAAHQFEALGATVGTTSIPWHLDGLTINIAIILEGSFLQMLRGNGGGTNWKGRYPVSVMKAFGEAKQNRADEMSDVMKVLTLLGEYLQTKYHGQYYAKAQNLAPALTEAYNAALSEFDILVMPSTPMKATPLPDADTPRDERWNLLLNMCPNTGPTCVTGHPAISVPCARSNGLPIGMMLIGRHWEDTTVLRAAHAFEQTGTYGDVVVRVPALTTA